MVADVHVETPDTVTLVLFTGNDRLEYQPGHFCTIDPHQIAVLSSFAKYFEDLKGKREVPRAYSLSSAPHEKRIAITVKEETYVRGKTKYPPLLSPYLVKQLHPGDQLRITGFTGPYTLSPDIESQTDHLVHVVAGSGAVPNFSIIKHALHTGLKLRHTFICSNRTFDDICFYRELDALAHQHPAQLRVIHTLTRETDETRFGPSVRKGRVSKELFAELIPDPSACIVYACGPAIGPHERAEAKEKGTTPDPRFLESAMEHLAAVGIPKTRIKHESYG